MSVESDDAELAAELRRIEEHWGSEEALHDFIEQEAREEHATRGETAAGAFHSCRRRGIMGLTGRSTHR